MRNNIAAFLIIMTVLPISSPAYSCNIDLNCDNVSYIMTGETWRFSVPANKWETVYAVAVFLAKEKFDFDKIVIQCNHENINIYAQGIHICEIPIDRFTSGALFFLRDDKEQAFNAARTICREKTDPNLRR
ncbi:MAG: hypothetical protein AB1916_02705 [Thermodesulfobacteriota bacterium]